MKTFFLITVFGLSSGAFAAESDGLCLEKAGLKQNNPACFGSENSDSCARNNGCEWIASNSGGCAAKAGKGSAFDIQCRNHKNSGICELNAECLWVEAN